MIEHDYYFITAAGAYLLDMRVDGKGIYHADFDGWQSVWGYNDSYDMVFNAFTSMDRAKFDFSSSGKDYILWAWKGDYLTLGAGTEMGIYYDSLIPGHWGVDKSLAMEMSLKLQYTDPITKTTSTIINYDPGDKQWWITAFNPKYEDVQANNLTATYRVTFNNSTMYEDFLKSRSYLDNKDKWSIVDADKFKMQFKF